MGRPVTRLIRVALLERAHSRCEVCGQQVFRYTWDAHHRQQRSVGGDDQLFNLLLVDRRCHDMVHRDVAWSRTQGWLVDSWGDPLTTSVRLFDGRFTLDGLGGMAPVVVP